MSVVTCTLVGHKLGNTMTQYAFARAYAEAHGCEFQCGRWIGQEIFELNDIPISCNLPRRSELDLKDGEVDFSWYGYSQNQRCMIYTREQVRKWFTIKPHLITALDSIMPSGDELVAHQRKGDYIGYGYVQVSEASYLRAAKQFGYKPEMVRFVTEETAIQDPQFGGNLGILPDWYRLLKAPILFRGNSTFSWWAATLGYHERVFAPVVEFRAGGQEHDCDFVEGNWPRFASLDFVTDMRIKE